LAEETTAPAEQTDDQVWDELFGAKPEPVAEAAPKPESDKVAEAPPEEKTSEPAPADDPWAAAPEPLRQSYEDVKKQLARAQHAERSMAGRYRSLRAQMASEPTKTTAAPTNGAATEQPADKPADRIESAFAKLAEDYPDIAGPLKDAFGALRTDNEHVGQQVAALHDERRNDAAHEQEALLTEAIPDWLQLSGDGRFAPWLNEQPRHIREAAQRNGNGIVDAEEAADVMGRFKAWKEWTDGQANGQQQTQQPAASAVTPKPSPSPLELKRQQQRASAVTVRSRGSAPATSIIPEDGDPDMIWKQFSQQGAFAVR
jgi:hypothetical protein